MRPVWAWSHIFRVLFFRALWDILLVAIVVAVLLVLRRVVGRRDHARDVIRERYGRGEIGKAEFDTKRADLKHT